jgi:hypothetical protein
MDRSIADLPAFVLVEILPCGGGAAGIFEYNKSKTLQ